MTNIDDLKQRLEALLATLDDPHPELALWRELYANRAKRVQEFFEEPSILDGAKVVAWEWPDGSQVRRHKRQETGQPYIRAYKRNGEQIVDDAGNGENFDTPEAAAEALAAIGQGPDSVRKEGGE